MVKHVIGTTNCTIELSDGSYKHVHMNQLKPVQTRNPELEGNGGVIEASVDQSCGEVFDALCGESSGEEVEESDESEGEDAVGDRWCGLDPRNIVASRTRGGGDG